MPFIKPLFSNRSLPPISVGPEQSGYDDKLWRVLGTADPGAVPGGSTTRPGYRA